MSFKLYFAIQPCIKAPAVAHVIGVRREARLDLNDFLVVVGQYVIPEQILLVRDRKLCAMLNVFSVP